MSLTLPQLVYNIRNIIKDNRSDDIKITDRQIEFMINHYRARLIKQDVDKNRSISSNIIQDLGRVPLSLIDAAEVSGTIIGKKILRSTDPIPKLIELNQKDAIVYIGGLDKQSNIDFVTKARSRWNKYNKYGKSLPTAYYRNGYIYISDCPGALKYINIEGIFADPREVSKYKNGSISCYDIMADPYPISEYMISPLNKLILTEDLSLFLEMVGDNINDANSQIKALAQKQ